MRKSSLLSCLVRHKRLLQLALPHWYYHPLRTIAAHSPYSCSPHTPLRGCWLWLGWSGRRRRSCSWSKRCSFAQPLGKMQSPAKNYYFLRKQWHITRLKRYWRHHHRKSYTRKGQHYCCHLEPLNNFHPQLEMILGEIFANQSHTAPAYFHQPQSHPAPAQVLRQCPWRLGRCRRWWH